MASILIDYSSPRANGIFQTDGKTFKTIVSGITGASGFAFGPDGNLYVSEEGGNKLDRFSPEGKRIGTTFGPGRRYTSMAFGPDGLMYVNSETDSYTSGYVRRYDPATGTPKGSAFGTTDKAQFTPSKSTYSEGIAFGADGNIYCPGRHSASVDAYQGPGGINPGALVTHLTGGLSTTGKITFGPDGAFYMSEDDGKVLRYDGKSFKVFASTHLSLPSGIVFGADGYMYVADVVASSIVRFQGPDGIKPGAFVDVFAKTPQPPDDLAIVPEPTTWALLIPASLVLATRRRSSKQIRQARNSYFIKNSQQE